MTDYKPTIWAWLKGNTELTNIGIAALMGNFELESSCEPCRRQSDFSADRLLSRNYAEDVDCGSISATSFAHDSWGWGLAQWTYFSRKQNLLEYCKSKGKSIADLTTQLEFCVKELQSEYSALWKSLLIATNLETATNAVLTQYERPAVLNLSARLNAAREILEKYKGTEPLTASEQTAEVYTVKIPKDIKKVILEIEE